MPLFEIDPNLLPKLKLGLHSAQIAVSFVIWCLEIAVFTARDAKVTGNNGWTFAVCFISAPGWIYLVMTPRFERTRRFAQPHAMLCVDVFFTILWLSAFATQAAYNSANDCGQACNLSRAIVGLGVIETLLFAATSFLSGYTLQYYNFHGNLPGYDARKLRSGGGDNIDPDKAAFSMAPHDDEAYERVNMDDHENNHHTTNSAYGGAGTSDYDNGYGPANPYSAADDDRDDPNRYGTYPPRINTMFDSETEYSSGAAGGAAGGGSSLYQPPHASQHPYDDGSAQFPAGNYDRLPALNRD
jgi:hypothetical protein